MLRALKLTTMMLSIFLVLGSCQLAHAQSYELGPFTVEGVGEVPPEAIQDAYGNMFDLIASIEATLPPGDTVLFFTIETEGFVDPYTYEIKFTLTIGPLPPNPPGGGLGV